MTTKFDNRMITSYKSSFGNKSYNTFRQVIDVELESLPLDFQIVS